MAFFKKHLDIFLIFAIFPQQKMIFHSKITENDLLIALQAAVEGTGDWSLPGLLQADFLVNHKQIDATVLMGWEGANKHLFAIEAKARNTPEAVETAISQAIAAAFSLSDQHAHPLVYVPYLSKERLDYLEKRQISGIDACGNALIFVPGQLYVRRDGNPNRFRDDRALINPFAGLSAMVARMLLLQREFPSLTSFHQAIRAHGVDISLSQVSKAIKALKEERIVSKPRGGIILSDPLRLLDKLAANWKPLDPHGLACNLTAGTNLLDILDSAKPPTGDKRTRFRWAVTGESSVERYASFSQHGPRKIAVTNLSFALEELHGHLKPSATRNFADVILIQTDENGYYFHNEVTKDLRWADRLQTWLELQAGDARQQEVAKDIRKQILNPNG